MLVYSNGGMRGVILHNVPFAEHSCLWNHKSESYRNRLLRQSLLETLSNLLSDNEPVPFSGNNDGYLCYTVVCQKNNFDFNTERYISEM